AGATNPIEHARGKQASTTTSSSRWTPRCSLSCWTRWNTRCVGEAMTGSVRVAAVGDLHCTKGSLGAFQTLFSRIGESADVLVLCGDLTDRGLADEARVLAKELQAVKMPKIAVLGNHDFESDAAADVVEILAHAEVTILDGTAVELSAGGLPVYNVALPLLQRLYPDRSPFRVVEIPAQSTAPAPPPVTASREPTQ